MFLCICFNFSSLRKGIMHPSLTLSYKCEVDLELIHLVLLTCMFRGYETILPHIVYVLMWIQTVDSSMLLKQSRNTQHSLFSLIAFPSLLYLCICGVHVCAYVHVCVHACMHTCAYVWCLKWCICGGQRTLLKLVLSFYLMGSGSLIQAKLQQLWLLCFLSSPSLATMFPLQLLI